VKANAPEGAPEELLLLEVAMFWKPRRARQPSSQQLVPGFFCGTHWSIPGKEIQTVGQVALQYASDEMRQFSLATGVLYSWQSLGPAVGWNTEVLTQGLPNVAMETGHNVFCVSQKLIAAKADASVRLATTAGSALKTSRIPIWPQKSPNS